MAQAQQEAQVQSRPNTMNNKWSAAPPKQAAATLSDEDIAARRRAALAEIER